MMVAGGVCENKKEDICAVMYSSLASWVGWVVLVVPNIICFRSLNPLEVEGKNKISFSLPYLAEILLTQLGWSIS